MHECANGYMTVTIVARTRVVVRTASRAQLEVGAWTEDRYNRRSRHSSIG